MSSKNIKISDDHLNQALDEISEVLYAIYKELYDGLPEGSNPEWGYDAELVIDIAAAVASWRIRQTFDKRNDN